jgi:hypothetical protein
MPSSKLASAAALTVLCTPALAGGPHVVFKQPGSSYTTPEATAELDQICPSGAGYPQRWTWRGPANPGPVSATSGTPRIEQMRNGKLIATYHSFVNQPGCTFADNGTDYLNPGAPAASGCGPFTREHTWRLWQAGDIFLVYPAVYSGTNNQPWIGPQYDDDADYSAGNSHAPDNVTLQGVVVNNTRPVILLDGPAADNNLDMGPVYFDQSNGFKIDNINVVAVRGAAAGKAGVYDVAASNLTLSNMRISGFVHTGANGLFGAGQYSGTLTLTGVELDHNGGTNGPAHNAYIGASTVDPNFTVIMQHSWTHDAYYGHLFKSRAQNNIFTANYFQGTLPFGHYSQAEAYLMDISNGGQLTAHDNVFVKNASGPDSNGMSISFDMEGNTDSRPQSVDIENNTFVTLAKTFDGSHMNYPLSFYYPNVIPGSASWPAGVPTRIIKNAFVGYCPVGGGSPQDYRGDLYAVESFAETTKAFALTLKVDADDKAMAKAYSNYQPVIGLPDYTQDLQQQPVRQKMTVGAED